MLEYVGPVKYAGLVKYAELVTYTGALKYAVQNNGEFWIKRYMEWLQVDISLLK